MARTRIDPTIAPENEALVAAAASRAIEHHEAGGKTSLRVQSPRPAAR